MFSLKIYSGDSVVLNVVSTIHWIGIFSTAAERPKKQ